MVRSDIPIGAQLAQSIHAAGESSPGNLPAGTYAVALHASGVDELLQVHHDITQAGIPSVLICEPDAPYLGQPTAIGVEPGPRDRVRRILRRLPLAFKEKS